MASSDPADPEPKDDKDFLSDVREKFELAANRERLNRENGLDDLRFARLGEQWPEAIRRQRELEGRPCMVRNKLPAFIRQVVNDARQNKPGITVHPADSEADVETAQIIEGLIRNIEVTSDADVAYDTALEGAVSNGFGYFRINTAYATDDSYDQDIVIERIANPFTVYGDPYSEAADSSDWNCAFVATLMSKDAFAEKYKGKEAVDWDGLGYRGLPSPWMDGDQVMVCEYWEREQIDKMLIALDNGEIVEADIFEQRKDDLAAIGINPAGEPRAVKSHKVTQYTLSGAEVLETIEWAGKYIPIVPVYGDEVNVEGERFFRSLICDAKDSQRDYNYQCSLIAEAAGYAPRVPFIGPLGAFKSAIKKWNTSNDASHAFIEYDGPIAPTRQAYAGPDLAAMQQARIASDDMKAILGMYDDQLGRQSNAQSGVAIGRRQAAGDTGTFHFIDNMVRAIRHAGRIIIDLIPHVYSTERVIRVLGQDMKPSPGKVAPGAPPQAQQQQQQQQAMSAAQAQMQAAQTPEDQQAAQAAMDQAKAIARIYDITAGKYDLTVKAGPPLSSQREEARTELVEIMRAVPESAMVLGPMYLRNSDWPGAEKAADEIEAMKGGQQPQGVPQEQVAQMQQQLQQVAQQAQQLAQENAQLKADQQGKADDRMLKQQELGIKEFEAQTDRIRAQADVHTALNQPPPSLSAVA